MALAVIGAGAIAGAAPATTARGTARAAAFRMIRGRPFVTAALDGGWNADFALAEQDAACTVRQELAAQVWPDDAPGSSHEATLTIGDVVLRRVACAIGSTNAISLSRLGWDVEFDYLAREVFLRPMPVRAR